MPKYFKPFLTYAEQLDLLSTRGMTVEDRIAAINALRKLGYYRLSAYWYPFRVREPNHREGVDIPLDQFYPGVSFTGILNAYEFDQSLRRAIWPALESVEIAVRVAIAYQMGQYGAYAFIDPHYLSDGAQSPSHRNPHMTQIAEFGDKMKISIRSSKESFAEHFRNNYEGTLPIWAAIELWDFGMLSSYYQIMSTSDRANVAANFGIQSARLLGSWLESINVLRNICAHHGRLNRRHFAVAPRIPKPKTSVEFAHLYPLSDDKRHTLYPLLCVLSYLMLRIEHDMRWQNDFTDAFNYITKTSSADFDDYGFPNDWQTQNLW